MYSFQHDIINPKETSGITLSNTPIEVITIIVQGLCVEDLLAFSSTCSSYRVFRWDWVVWDALSQRHFSVPLKKPEPESVASSVCGMYQGQGQIQWSLTIGVDKLSLTQPMETKASDPYHKFREIAREFPTFYLVCFHTSGGWNCDEDHIALNIESVEDYMENLPIDYRGDLEVYKFRGTNGVYEVSKLMIPTRSSVPSVEEEEWNTYYEYTKRTWIHVDPKDIVYCHRMNIRDFRCIGCFSISSYAEHGSYPNITDRQRIYFTRLLSIEPIRTGFLSLMVADPNDIKWCDNYYFEKYYRPACQKLYERIIPPPARIYLDSALKIMREPVNYII